MYSCSSIFLMTIGVLLKCVFGVNLPILLVTRDCLYDRTNFGTARISVISDHIAKASAKCSGNHVIPFAAQGRSGLVLDISYAPPVTDSSCYFKRKDVLFTVEVTVVVGDRASGSGIFLQTYSRMYTVTCTRQNKTMQETEVKSIILPIAEVKVIEDERSVDNVTASVPIGLNIVNLNGLSMAGVRIGQNVCLKASPLNDSISIAGFQPINCVASGVLGNALTGEQYMFLKAGCGDGYAIGQTNGFTTTGNVVVSPPFPFFRIGYSDSLMFSCTFSFCTSPCDGNSCPEHVSNKV